MRNEQYKQFNCYSILAVQFNATPGEIKAAWKKISLRTHPDLGGSNAEQAKVNLAYEVLSDPIQRQVHDIYWRSSTSSTTGQKARHANAAQKPSAHHASAGKEALATFRKRLEQAIQAKKATIWSGLAARVQEKTAHLQQQLGKAKERFFYEVGIGLILGLIAMHIPIVWIAVIWLGSMAFSKLKGVDVHGKKFSIFDNNTERLGKHAENLAAKQCHDEANRFDRYITDFAAILELAMRSSSFDDSELQVARRIAVSLFLMGYTPSYYDSESRAILFADGDEKLVVRFRHRTGSAINITYVEKLHTLMQRHKAEGGILFCSPGLSGNAAKYAQRHGIKWYTLESMNAWIDEILPSDYSGPGGDILENLQKLTDFLAQITPKVGRSHYRPRRYRRYCSWR